MNSLLNKRVDQMTGTELLQLLNEYAPSIPSQKTKSGKVKKVKDPSKPKKEVSEGVKAWNAVVAEVLEDMKESGWTHPETGKPVTRKDAMAEASKRKAAEDPEYAAKAEARKQKRVDKSSRKNSDASQHEEAAKDAAKEADKPSTPVAEKKKKVLSPEHLAKMKEGREAKKAATNAAVALAAPSLPVAPPKASSSIASPKKAAKTVPKVEVPAEEKEADEWIKKTISSKKYLWNPANNHCYRCEADGTQGDWAGLYDPKKVKIDETASEPVDFEE